MIPLPFAAQHHAYTAGVVNDDGNTVPGHLDPVAVACVWWAPSGGSSSGLSTEPQSGPINSDRVTVDVIVAVDSALVVDSRDYFTLAEYGDVRLNVVGLPKDYDHGPFGFAPGRRIVELKAVLG